MRTRASLFLCAIAAAWGSFHVFSSLEPVFQERFFPIPGSTGDGPYWLSPFFWAILIAAGISAFRGVLQPERRRAMFATAVALAVYVAAMVARLHLVPSDAPRSDDPAGVPGLSLLFCSWAMLAIIVVLMIYAVVDLCSLVSEENSRANQRPEGTPGTCPPSKPSQPPVVPHP
jgi:uncharacterized membrane protein YhaH (DUF805 family)